MGRADGAARRAEGDASVTPAAIAKPAAALPGTLSAPALWVCYLLGGGLALSPLLAASIPTLIDYPSHLARMAILAAPDASENYIVHWRLVPNLAMDLIVPPLSHVIGLELAGRVFLALLLLQLLGATAWLHRVLHGRIGLWPLVSILFLYNIVLYYGFLNYLFGLGTALLVFGGWIRSAAWPIWPRLVLFSLLAALVFVLHLFAFGVYGLLIGAYELGRLVARRRISGGGLPDFLLVFVQFIPALALWLANAAAEGSRRTVYGVLLDKLAALAAPLNFNDFGAIAAPLVLCVFFVALRRGGLRLAPAMRFPLAIGGIAAVLMPVWLYGSWGADLRLPVALAFVAIASTEPRFSSRATALAAALAMAMLMTLRVAEIAGAWGIADRHFDEFRQAIRGLPRGARLIVAHPDDPTDLRFGDAYAIFPTEIMLYRHMDELAVIDRDCFVPYLGMVLGPVDEAPRNEGLYVRQGVEMSWGELSASAYMQVSEAETRTIDGFRYWYDWPDKFDYLLMIDFGDRLSELPPYLTLWHQGSFFSLYKVSAPSRSSAQGN
jgi:hypothetical protein